MARLYHIVAETDWRAACTVGSYQPPSLAEQGFVHFSHEHQVGQVANLLYSGADGLIVVEVAEERLPAPVIEEDLYEAGERFPHVYAAIPTDAAVAEHPLRRDVAGNYRFP
jgi:uncharacterized protein (DUF952 family)